MENNQKKEVNEALHAIEETLGHLSRAQDYLVVQETGDFLI